MLTVLQDSGAGSGEFRKFRELGNGVETCKEFRKLLRSNKIIHTVDHSKICRV